MKTEDEVALSSFAVLAESKIFREYKDAFRMATGATLKIVPPGDECANPLVDAASGNPFCGQVARTAAGCEACRLSERQALRRAARSLHPQQIYCYAGLTTVAVPVVVDGRHVATLLSGQVFRREPTQRDFEMVIKMLGDGVSRESAAKLRQTYFATPVITADRFQAIVELVKVYARYLAEFAGRSVLAVSEVEPAAVIAAKEFVHSHFEEPVRLAQLAQHARVSPFHLCKLFKQATGMTLTDYVTRLRVEKAKSLLADPALRISEIVFASGFGSIPRFNSAFKQHVGMPPTDYRTSLRERIAS